MKITFLSFFLLLTISIVSGQTSEQYIVSSQTLNMRIGAGTQYEVMEKLSQGDAVSLLEKFDSGWWHVNFEGKFGYVFSQYLKKDPYTGWEKKNYKSGVAPECENVIPEFDYTLDNFLRINVGSGTDVVIKLMRVGTFVDECIRIVYVRSKETYDIMNIPEGKYYVKIAYGKDYRQKIVDNKCYVKFMSNAMYEKGSELLDMKKIKQPDRKVGNKIYESWTVPSFELFLDVLVEKGSNSEFKANGISEAEFNK